MSSHLSFSYQHFRKSNVRFGRFSSCKKFRHEERSSVIFSIARQDMYSRCETTQVCVTTLLIWSLGNFLRIVHLRRILKSYISLSRASSRRTSFIDKKWNEGKRGKALLSFDITRCPSFPSVDLGSIILLRAWIFSFLLRLADEGLHGRNRWKWLLRVNRIPYGRCPRASDLDPKIIAITAHYCVPIAILISQLRTPTVDWRSYSRYVFSTTKRDSEFRQKFKMQFIPTTVRPYDVQIRRTQLESRL